ncbi:MAG TPA: caspase family protein, partial [Candidatus Obscuribacterales bacterium]
MESISCSGHEQTALRRPSGQAACLALALVAVAAALLWDIAPVSAEAAQGAEASPDRPIRDKWAVVIGIERFQDERVPQLQYAAKDAMDFANFLVESGNFSRDHVVLLTNEQATENEIKRVIGDDWLPRRVLQDDVVVIFISAHGSPKELDVAGQNFLLAYDTNVDNLFSTAIELEDLAVTVRKRTLCDRVVLFLDACNSGAAEAKGGKGVFTAGNFDLSSIAGTGTIVVSSSYAQQRSWESKRYQNGVFTRRLIESLGAKGPQTKLSEAFESLRDTVEQEVKFDRKLLQSPVMKMDWKGGELALLAPPVRPRATQPYQPSGTGGREGQDEPGGGAVAVAPQPTTPTVPAPGEGSTAAGRTGGPEQAKQISIGIAPFGGPAMVRVFPSFGVLWGVVKRPEELFGLPGVLGDRLSETFSATMPVRVTGQQKLLGLLKEYLSAAVGSEGLALSRPSKNEWRRFKERSGVDFVLAGCVDEVVWRPTTWSNRYTFVVSAVLIDASTGVPVIQLSRLTVAKAPWSGDMG